MQTTEEPENDSVAEDNPEDNPGKQLHAAVDNGDVKGVEKVRAPPPKQC